MMEALSLSAKEIRKDFNRRIIFEHISFDLSGRDSLSVTGKNGSGKTTLLRIISGVLTPTHGSVTMKVGAQDVRFEDRRKYLGFVAPYLQLYDEFTGYENLVLATKIRGGRETESKIIGLLKRVDLVHCKDDRVGTYSSGMKQRLKYAFALLHSPLVLILDEPMSNLDAAGIEVVRQIIDEQKQFGIVLMATNDADEARLCQQTLDLDAPKPSELAVFP